MTFKKTSKCKTSCHNTRVTICPNMLTRAYQTRSLVFIHSLVEYSSLVMQVIQVWGRIQILPKYGKFVSLCIVSNLTNFLYIYLVIWRHASVSRSESSIRYKSKHRVLIYTQCVLQYKKMVMIATFIFILKTLDGLTSFKKLIAVWTQTYATSF